MSKLIIGMDGSSLLAPDLQSRGGSEKLAWPTRDNPSHMARNSPSPGSKWKDLTPNDIMRDINFKLDLMRARTALPDTIIIPRIYVYPAPIRFRVTGKRGRGAIERERQRQAKGLSVRIGVFG